MSQMNHGGTALEEQVIRLYREGWHVANIASIAKCKPGVVEQILRDKGIMM